VTGPGSDNGDSVTAASGDPSWRESATTWLDDSLHAAGMRRTGEVTQPYVRPWATVLSAPTNADRVRLKAMSPGTAFEVRLCGLLVRLTPETC
jgi:hypothetical protein